MSSVGSHVLVLLSLPLLFRLGTAPAYGADMFDTGGNVTDGETLVSAGGSFTMGFFSLGAPARRYLGIWFSVSEDAVCWVANRDRPINGTSGVLVLGNAGRLILLEGSQVAWSTNPTGAASPVAQLLESGNLVVRDRNSSALRWQSFDHPSNTLLPGMKTGKNLWTGTEWYITSWRSATDPSPGAYRRGIETKGLPEIALWRGDVKKYRTGPWNGLYFNGVPEMASYADMFAYQVTVSPGEVTYGYYAKVGAPLSRIVVTVAGAIERLVWDPSSRAWTTFYSAPRDVCDAYARCGAFGLCDVNAASTSFCGCVEGFTPASPTAWSMREMSAGCRRRVALDCGGNGGTDGFTVVRGVKLPDTNNVSVDASIGLDECRTRCLANCSCMAYAAADVRGGAGAGRGCIIWSNEIVDVRYIEKGQDLYLRLAKSELPMHDARSSKISAAIIAAICVVCAAAAVFLWLAFILLRRNMRGRISRDARIAVGVEAAGKPMKATAVASIDLRTVEKATENFSAANVIGEGAFGVVYEGQLPGDHPLVEGLPGTGTGRKVAVKRLRLPTSLPGRVLNDFTREVELVSELRHHNLVRLLAYCNDGNERILVYDYVPNKSLNLLIFGEPSVRATLGWAQRLEIIRGIGQGLGYLHGEDVIHRDLKPSNVLLDQQWRPKIADFGTAKPFRDDQTGTQTVVVTPGYASPECANDGVMTLKCDVFSFGVVVLEIISGHRNTEAPSVVSQAWRLWEENRVMDLLDAAVAPTAPHSSPDLSSELRRCIHIGLLCVQQSPGDRPAMAAVLAMLASKGSRLEQPKGPARRLGLTSYRGVSLD